MASQNKPQFFTDTHISGKATKQLRLSGVDIVRCEEVGLAEADDSVLLEYATQHGRCMISCDNDFRDLHFEWLAQEKKHAGILYMNEQRHCKYINEIVRIVTFYHDLADTATDLHNEFWEGNKAR